jgi:formylglycine-generating enzyme required for sulfatase activity
LIGGAAGFFLWKSSQQPTTTVAGTTKTTEPVAPPPPPPTVGPAGVEIRSTPAGATVSIDGVQQSAQTPATLQPVAPGEHTVVISLSGYRSATNVVRVKAGETNTVDFANMEVMPATAIVKTVPPGARIWIDSVEQKELTPAQLPIKPGNHIFIVSMTGYQAMRKDADAKAGGTYSLDFGALPALASGVDVRSVPAGANISIDGKRQKQMTPAIIAPLSPGEHQVVVSLTGYKAWAKNIDLKPGQTNVIDFGELLALPAAVDVHTEPEGAFLWVDSVQQPQRTPVLNIPLSAGEHVFVATLEGYRAQTNKVRLKANETNVVQITSFIRPTATLVISSQPTEALVMTNGKSASLTPCTLVFAPGQVKVELFQEGFQMVQKTVTLNDGDKQPLDIIMSKANISSLGVRITNSLGMVLAPVTNTSGLFCIWETRVRDFQAFVTAAHYEATTKVLSLTANGWKPQGYSWVNPGFPQSQNDPACCISWVDATAFCAWLTKVERSKGLIAETEEYRLPTDAEWSVAVGLKVEKGRTPEEKNRKVENIYPWGTAWPPKLTGSPKPAGNFSGSEDKTQYATVTGHGTIVGFNDKYPRTAPVGQFAPNSFGLYDLGGNVREWCEDWYDGRKTDRTLRGGDWTVSDFRDALSSNRDRSEPAVRKDHTGFRVVLMPVRQ